MKKGGTAQTNKTASGGPSGPKGKQFNLAESFKLQCEIGDIELSGKGLNDNHSWQIAQLLRQYAKEGVSNLDLSNNKITDEGILNICKALNET